MEPLFFEAPAEFRSWLEANHARAAELWVGFYKKGTGKQSITWPESVDQALSFGWIDGVRKSLGDASYTIRFTKRKPGSTWSAINIRRVGELRELGLMTPAGETAFDARKAEKSAIYSYEQARATELSEDFAIRFQANPAAWQYFRRQMPSYQRQATYWVMSAKQAETRERRLGQLIDDSSQERWLAQYRWGRKTRQS